MVVLHSRFSGKRRRAVPRWRASSVAHRKPRRGPISRPVEARSPEPRTRRSTQDRAGSGIIRTVNRTNQELADFLRRARGQIDPARAGLPPDGRVRRVPGLRREEVARLRPPRPRPAEEKTNPKKTPTKPPPFPPGRPPAQPPPPRPAPPPAARPPRAPARPRKKPPPPAGVPPNYSARLEQGRRIVPS